MKKDSVFLVSARHLFCSPPGRLKSWSGKESPARRKAGQLVTRFLLPATYQHFTLPANLLCFSLVELKADSDSEICFWR